jgi:cytochrome P450
MVLATLILAVVIAALIYLIFWDQTVTIGTTLKRPPQLPLLGNIHQLQFKDIVYTLERWAYEMGPIFEIKMFNSPKLVVADHAAIQEVLKARPQSYSRGAQITRVFEDLNTHALFSEEGAEWKVSRQMIVPAFSNAKILSTRGIIVRHCLELRKTLANVAVDQEHLHKEMFTSGKITFDHRRLIPLLPKLQVMALKIILEAAFLAGNADAFDEKLLKDITVMFRTTGNRLFEAIPLYKVYQTEDDRISTKTISYLNDYIDSVIEEYYKNPKDDENNLTVLKTVLHNLQANNEKVSHEKVRGNLIQVMVAGYETTAATLDWITFYLAKYPGVMRKIQKEVESVLGDFDNPSKPLEDLTLQDFPYTQNVVYEVMRLSPV